MSSIRLPEIFSLIETNSCLFCERLLNVINKNRKQVEIYFIINDEFEVKLNKFDE